MQAGPGTDQRRASPDHTQDFVCRVRGGAPSQVMVSRASSTACGCKHNSAETEQATQARPALKLLPCVGKRYEPAAIAGPCGFRWETGKHEGGTAPSSTATQPLHLCSAQARGQAYNMSLTLLVARRRNYASSRCPLRGHAPGTSEVSCGAHIASSPVRFVNAAPALHTDSTRQGSV